MTRRRLVPYSLLAPGLGWLLVFFVVPMGFMAYISLNSGSLISEEGFKFTWNWGNFEIALTDYTEHFGRSFLYGGIATVLALVIAYPLAYAIAFRGGRWKTALLFAVIAPFFTTYLIRSLAWQTILSDQSPTVDLMRSLGLVEGGVLKTPGAVIAGLTYNFLPFMVLPIYASLEQIDERLIEAGRDLYASARETFLRVTLPLSLPGVVAGTLLTFIPAVGDYVNAEFLGAQGEAMIGNVIQGQYLEVKDYPVAAALSFVLMSVIMAIVVVYIRFVGEESLMGEEAKPA